MFDFQRTKGVVATIKGESASKSEELAEALSGNKKIAVCTIQTFPFALKAVRELTASHGKRFAVIADEANSSQTGEAASMLKAVLSAEEQQELADGGEVSTEDISCVLTTPVALKGLLPYQQLLYFPGLLRKDSATKAEIIWLCEHRNGQAFISLRNEC